jgi:hypothetical protein
LLLTISLSQVVVVVVAALLARGAAAAAVLAAIVSLQAKISLFLRHIPLQLVVEEMLVQQQELPEVKVVLGTTLFSLQ